MSDRYRSTVDVHLVLRQASRVLLTRRGPGLYAAGLLHLPSGHLEEGEHAAQACVRETYEEIGIALGLDRVRLVLTMHQRHADGAARVGLFFEPTAWTGTPYNREPDKAVEMGWYDVNALPIDMVQYPANAIEAISRGERFALHGWSDDQVVRVSNRG